MQKFIIGINHVFSFMMFKKRNRLINLLVTEWANKFEDQYNGVRSNKGQSTYKTEPNKFKIIIRERN